MHEKIALAIATALLNPNIAFVATYANGGITALLLETWHSHQMWLNLSMGQVIAQRP